MIEAIDSILLAVPNLDGACRPYEGLGLFLSPAQDGRRSLQVGNAGNLVSVEFVIPYDGPLAEPIRRALDSCRPLFAVVLRTTDPSVILARLAQRGIHATRIDDDQTWLPLHELAGTDLILLRSSRSGHPNAALMAHAMPLRRLDHLAVVTHDLDVKTRFWADALGIPVAGEVTTPTMVIRQFRLGDAMLELLGPASPDSPLTKRPPGLISMASWEVEDLNALVGHARNHGFTISDPAAGPLPGTRVATVQGAELAGVNMQLLEHV